jgi:hypothetical protein
MHDEADGDEIALEMIEERAAARAAAERPAERVLDRAGPAFAGRDLPELLQADAEFRRLAAGVEPEAGDRLLRQRAAHALAEEGVFAAQLHAAGESVFRLAVAADAHVAGGDPDDGARLVEQ